MGFFMDNILNIVCYLPIVGLIVIMFTKRENENTIKWIANITAFLGFLVSIPLLTSFNDPRFISPDGYRFVFDRAWIPQIGANYKFGIDGISMLLVLLTTLLGTIAILSSWTAIKERVKEYYAFMLLLQTGMLGVFMAMDFLVFYVFWEIMLVPMYFLIGVWGGPRKLYAAIKFFLYTLAGSVLMLVGILAIYFYQYSVTGIYSFDIVGFQKLGFPTDLQWWVFLAFFIGFAIKVPMFPFHTWLPDTHVEAPTAGSVILAGVLLKMGTYGFVRILLPILPGPSRYFALVIALLALASILYGALVAMAQTDLKKLIAYSSVNHMGYVMLGIAASVHFMGAGDTHAVSRVTALNGAVLQMVGHGIITGALFFLVGVIYDRAHTRDMNSLGGLAKQMPVYAGLMMMASFASLGLPTMLGFVAEFLVFIGSFGTMKIVTGIAMLGVVFTAGYFLWMMQRVFLGELNRQWVGLPDIDRGELAAIVPLCVLMLAFGLYPQPILNMINTAMFALVNHMGTAAQAAQAFIR